MVHFSDKLEIHLECEGVLLLPPASKAWRKAPDVQKTHSRSCRYRFIRTRSVDRFDAFKCVRSVMTSAATNAYCSAAGCTFTSRSPPFAMFLKQLLQFDGQMMHDSDLSPSQGRMAQRCNALHACVPAGAPADLPTPSPALVSGHGASIHRAQGV